MKPKSIIITDLKKMAEICANQPQVTREQAVRTILVANGRKIPPELQTTRTALGR